VERQTIFQKNVERTRRLDKFLEMESTSQEVAYVLPSSSNIGKETFAWINWKSRMISNIQFQMIILGITGA
jgi:hypothetical protein